MKVNLRSIDLNLLTIFDALMVEQHLTRASHKLNMSQPAVSNALQRLRVLLDDDLFIRTANGMLPTSRARGLQEPIGQALNIIQSQLSPLEEFDYQTAKHRFSISINDYGECVLLPQMIGVMRELAPNISLDIFPDNTSGLSDLLRSGDLDVAVDYLPLKGKEFEHEKVFEEDLVVVASSTNKKLGDKINVKTYQSLPHVSVHRRSEQGSPLEIVLGIKHIKRNVQLYVPHLVAMPALVANSDMLCTIPLRLAEHFSQLYPLKILELPFKLDPVPVYLIWHRDQRDSVPHSWIRNQIMQFAQVAVNSPTLTD